MVSDVAAEKLGQWFDVLDAAGHGYLTRDDFQAVATRLARRAGVAEAPAVTESFLRVWDSLAENFGIDRGGKLMRVQYIEGFAALAETSPQFVNTAAAYIPEVIFALFDTDDDRRLSKDEFLSMLAALGLPEAKAQVAHLALDHDADGYIGADEFVEASRQFVLSDDPYALGNWLLGGLAPKPIRYF